LLPGAEDIYVGTGYGGNGITLGSLAAKIICSLITCNDNKYAELFDPGRIKMVAGFSNFVKENADVVSKFIGMRFSYEQVSSLVELAPGEAMLAEWEGNKVALYKDENSKVHALDPVCPHAKCIVDWNNAEKSWDCPCHGSRFAPNGALLTGPATTGLTQIKWEDIEGD
jgi:Rieske Fe-S protein